MDQAHWDQSTQLFTKLSTENVQNFQPADTSRIILLVKSILHVFARFLILVACLARRLPSQGAIATFLCMGKMFFKINGIDRSQQSCTQSYPQIMCKTGCLAQAVFAPIGVLVTVLPHSCSWEKYSLKSTIFTTVERLAHNLIHRICAKLFNLLFADRGRSPVRMHGRDCSRVCSRVCSIGRCMRTITGKRWR